MRVRTHPDADSRPRTDAAQHLWAAAWLSRAGGSERQQVRSTVAAVHLLLETGRLLEVHSHGRTLPGDEAPVRIAWAGAGWVVVGTSPDPGGPDVQWVRQSAPLGRLCEVLALPGTVAWVGDGAALDVTDVVRLAAAVVTGQVDPDVWQFVHLPEVDQ